MTFQEAVSALRDFGFPGGLLIALCYAGWKWGWYVLDEILKPASHQFIAFMEHLMAAVTKLTDSSERVCDQMKQQSDQMKQQSNQISNHGEQLTLHGKTLEEIRGMLKK